MGARAKVASFGTLLLGSAVAACSPSDRSRPQAPLHQRSYFESSVSAEPEGVVSVEFDAAIRAYRTELRGLPSRGAEDVEIRKMLRLLTVAIERVPGAGDVDVGRTSAIVRGTRVRALTGHEVMQSGSDAAPMRGVEHSLAAVSETFTALARGPYRNSHGLLAEVYAFDEAARRTHDSAGEAACRHAAVEALRRAERVLLALQQAASRGELDSGERTAVTW